MNRWNEPQIEYTNIEKIKAALVGRSIVATETEGESYSRVISFKLDDGTTLKAHATDGGCGCTNGCFTVDNPDSITGTILNVEVSEEAQTYDYAARENERKQVTPGSISDGEATIRIYVYTEIGKATLIESEGGDNGYYGWGFWLSVDTAEAGR